MREKIAFAIFSQFFDPTRSDAAVVWANTKPAGFLAAADRVLDAMQKPSTKMLKAACKAMAPGKRPTEKWVSNRLKHSIRYRAMITAAKPAQGE